MEPAFAFISAITVPTARPVHHRQLSCAPLRSRLPVVAAVEKAHQLQHQNQPKSQQQHEQQCHAPNSSIPPLPPPPPSPLPPPARIRQGENRIALIGLLCVLGLLCIALTFASFATLSLFLEGRHSMLNFVQHRLSLAFENPASVVRSLFAVLRRVLIASILFVAASLWSARAARKEDSRNCEQICGLDF